VIDVKRIARGRRILKGVFGRVCFTEDDRALRPQGQDDFGIASSRQNIGTHSRARSRVHAFHVDQVLDADRDTVKRPPYVAVSSLLLPLTCNSQCAIRIDFGPALNVALHLLNTVEASL